MALFFFNFFDGTSLSPDEAGVELPSVELAYLEASSTAIQMWPDLLTDRLNPLECAFDIANADGEVLLRFDFRELLDVGRSEHVRPSAPLEMVCSSLVATHRRAQQAKAELFASIKETRQALDESKSLLERI